MGIHTGLEHCVCSPAGLHIGNNPSPTHISKSLDYLNNHILFYTILFLGRRKKSSKSNLLDEIETEKIESADKASSEEEILFIKTPIHFLKSLTTICLTIQGGRGHWAFHYTGSQSFMITFSY